MHKCIKELELYDIVYALTLLSPMHLDSNQHEHDGKTFHVQTDNHYRTKLDVKQIIVKYAKNKDNINQMTQDLHFSIKIKGVKEETTF